MAGFTFDTPKLPLTRLPERVRPFSMRPTQPPALPMRCRATDCLALGVHSRR